MRAETLPGHCPYQSFSKAIVTHLMREETLEEIFSYSFCYDCKVIQSEMNVGMTLWKIENKSSAEGAAPLFSVG